MNKPTDNLGATDEEVADSLREDVIAAFKICNQQRARIADLESELATLKREARCSKCGERVKPDPKKGFQ